MSLVFLHESGIYVDGLCVSRPRLETLAIAWLLVEKMLQTKVEICLAKH